MNTSRLFLAVFAAFLTSSSFSTLRAKDSLGDKDFPKHFHWQGEIKGETVVMDIDAEYFVAAKHKVRDGGDSIDGYGAAPGYLTSWGSGFPYFTINDWRIRWGRKRLRPFPKGVYTSIFTPQLVAEKRPDADHVEVFVCGDGDALMVTMGFGYDGVTGTIAFVITKDGRVRRFITGEFS